MLRCQSTLTAMATRTAQLATKLDSRDPAVGLPAVAALRSLLEDVEAAHVRHARNRGWSWEAIAGALGVSRQAVHRKHAKRGGRR